MRFRPDRTLFMVVTMTKPDATAFLAISTVGPRLGFRTLPHAGSQDKVEFGSFDDYSASLFSRLESSYLREIVLSKCRVEMETFMDFLRS